MRLPTRSKKYGVGKVIGGCVYMHRSYVKDTLPDVYKLVEKQSDVYNIVKVNERTGVITVLCAPDFDAQLEPVIRSWKVINGTKPRKQVSGDNPPVYHHKWLFVKDDYKGFDVGYSKKRSEDWMRYKDHMDMALIGRYNYWKKILETFNLYPKNVTCDICNSREITIIEDLTAEGYGNFYFCSPQCKERYWDWP
jgi:hypothetical protein